MRIGQRPIGLDHPPYVIAEIGVNHDGEVSRALELTDAAAEAGADAVKLQYFETDRLMSKAAKLAAYQQAAGETDPISMLRRLELTLDEMAQVVERAHAKGIHAIVTVFSTELVGPAETLAWDAYKTASPDIVNFPLLKALVATSKPLIVSTGASTWRETQDAFYGPLEVRAADLAILQCVSSYPTPREQASIAGMLDLPRDLIHSGGVFGYSDHCSAIDTGGLAVRIGAAILEKHLTYDTLAPGPDHAASLSPSDFGRYVINARQNRMRGQDVENFADFISSDGINFSLLTDDPAYGPIEKRVLDCERDVRTVSRQSVVSVGPIAAGTTITREHLTIKRPGTGILAYRLDEVVGRVAARDIEGDVPVLDEDLRAV